MTSVAIRCLEPRHRNTDPRRLPWRQEAALSGGGIFLDLGSHALDYLDRRHDRIVSLHIKDRRRDQGPNVPFGEGDTPIVAVLQRLRERKWDIPAQIEYEYKGGDTIAEVRRCYEYCRRALEEK